MRIASTGEEVHPRGLTRGEIARLEGEGLQPDGAARIEDIAERDAAIDCILHIVLPDLDTDALSPAEHMELYTQVVNLTYLGEGALKKFAAWLENGSGAASDPVTPAKPKAGKRSKGKGNARS